MPNDSSVKNDYFNKVNIVIEFINNNLDAKLSLDHLAKISNLSLGVMPDVPPFVLPVSPRAPRCWRAPPSS